MLFALTGCDYAPAPDTPTATASATPQSSRTGAALRGTTVTNTFHLAMSYTSADGDTWDGIAQAFGMPTSYLRAFNPDATLITGTVLDLRGRNLPQRGAGGHFDEHADGSGTYGVKPEDSFVGLNSRFGVPDYAIRAANPSIRGMDRVLSVEPGTTITIPSSR
jgi:LysM repeat protein